MANKLDMLVKSPVSQRRGEACFAKLPSRALYHVESNAADAVDGSFGSQSHDDKALTLLKGAGSGQNL